MDALNIFTSLFVSEPQKTFAKAGLTDKDGFLTADGAKIFQKWQLARDAEAFKSEVADKMVAEMEKAK